MANSSGRKLPSRPAKPAYTPPLLNTPEGRTAAGWDSPNAKIERTARALKPSIITVGPGTTTKGR